MSGFSPDWLALREPVDHRSRDLALARRLAEHFKAKADTTVVDIGCGTGSNLRATALLLGNRQNWTLVDYDARLLAAAEETLAHWADQAIKDDAGLLLSKGKRSISVSFRQADLAGDLERGLGAPADLVTSSAFFDLASPAFIARFAKAVAARRSAFYTVLTYNGEQTWTPPHEADITMAYAFHAHQQTDKGLNGVAAGPDAPDALAKAFAANGYDVAEGVSPWTLGAADQTLVTDLASGFANAVEETRRVPAASLTSWRKVARTGAVVGHTDTLALPR